MACLPDATSAPVQSDARIVSRAILLWEVRVSNKPSLSILGDWKANCRLSPDNDVNNRRLDANKKWACAMQLDRLGPRVL
jgi:hypothetical protein